MFLIDAVLTARSINGNFKAIENKFAAINTKSAFADLDIKSTKVDFVILIAAVLTTRSIDDNYIIRNL